MGVFLLALIVAQSAPAQETFLLSGTISGPSGALSGIPVTVRARAEFGNEILLDTTVTSDTVGAFSVSVPASYVDLHAAPPPQLNLDAADVFNLRVRENLSVRMTTAPLVTLSGEVKVPSGLPMLSHLDIRSLTADRVLGASVVGGRFEARVRGDVYSIQASYSNRTLGGRVNVDTTAGDVRNIQMTIAPIAERNPFVIEEAPRADLISFSTPDVSGNSVISGAAGAVEPLSAVLLGNRSTGQINLTTSREDGSFTAPLFAPAGSAVMVRHDPIGRYLPFLTVGGPNVSTNHAPATTVHSPLPAQRFASSGPLGGAFESMQLSAVRSVGVTDPGSWHLSGLLPEAPVEPGRPFTLTGTLTLFLRDVETAGAAAGLTVSSHAELEQIVDGEGLQRRSRNAFVSTHMTPSGLPIERRGPVRAGLGGARVGTPRFVQPGMVEAEWILDGFLDPNTPPGTYRPRIHVGVRGKPAAARHFDVFPVMGETYQLSGNLPLLRVGNAPLKMVWMLGLDHFSNGSRGAMALEDRGRVGISSKVMTNSSAFVVPLRDERTGQPARIRLEPYLPLLSVTTGNGGTPETPQVAFRFPSGSLTAVVRKPDGSVETIGPAPFAQISFRTPVSRAGESLTNATNHVSDFHRLTTNDPRFDYPFSQWGRHTITLEGTVEDIYGNLFEGGGTYEVDVARPIDFETGILPGTPFSVGESLSTSVVLQPPLSADVTVTVRHYPDSAVDRVETYQVRGSANRFGHFSGQPVKLDSAGEYRVDVHALATDSAGAHWVGSATWGGIVETPSSRLITRGRRGFDLVDRIQDQWLFVRRSRAGGDHLMFPFHGGDVMWMSKDDPAADIPKITVQDPDGTFAQRVRNRSTMPGAAWESPSIEERITAGEIPLFSTLSGSSVDSPIEQWGYFYAAVSRPGVRVREFISEDDSSTGYWRFADAYNLQLGNGINGDLPNDFKFQFGGAVWRDHGFRYYGGYASFFVLLPFNDELGGRIFPPFQGNGGGPDGGPLFTLKGKEIDLFFHPTAVRPGTILHRGERVSFAGYSAPTLPVKIEIVVTSPSGRVRTIAGQANKTGYFHDPSQDFTVGESGVWKAKVSILFDGRTSAGQVTEPYPTGDVLGSRAGELYFYVVDANAHDLAIGPMPQFVRPADGPITFTIQPPAGLSNRQLTWTTTMPGFILEEGTTSAMTYTYDAPRLAKDFPNLDLYDADGFAGADTITISFLLSGTGASGARKHFARQIVIQGEELQMPDQEPRPKRRAVR